MERSGIVNSLLLSSMSGYVRVIATKGQGTARHIVVNATHLTPVSDQLVKSFSSITKRLSGEIKDCKDQVTDISASVYI
jgi:hypothetical protein